MENNDPQAGAGGPTPSPLHRVPPRRRRHPFLWAALAVLAGVIAAGAGGLTWARSAGWTTAPPAVLGIAPPPGSRDVPGDTPISIAFNMPMNPESVRANLTIEPATAGTITWEGNTLLFHPQPGYRRGVTYTVRVGKGARSPLFQGLVATASTTFKTAGLPALYRSVPPSGATDVPTDTLVTLQFSQPMAALTTVDNGPDVSGQVRVQPDPGGHWQWLGSTTLTYRAAPLQPATHYSVQVAHTLTDRAGSPLDRDYSFDFTTIRPAVVATQPETDTKFVGIHDPLVVTFNQPVDHASAEAGFHLAPAAAGSFTWAPDSSVFTYTPAAALPEDTAIRATLTGVKPAVGALALAAPYTWGFRTSPRPRVLDTQPANGAQAVAAGNQIIVHYTAPLSLTESASELPGGIRFDPPVRGVSAYAYDEGATLNIFAPLAPSTNYTVTVGAGDAYPGRDGRPVPAYTWHFRTARTTPDARVLSADSLLSAYAGLPTRVYLRAVNVDGFLRMRLWKLGGDELAAYMQLTPDQRATYGPHGTVARMWDIPVTYRLDQPLALNPAIALDESGDRLPPGFYYLRVSTPQTGNSPGTINGTALIVGNAGLIMKQASHEIWVWAVDMGTGKALAGRPISIMAGATPAGNATTDADGLAHITGDWSQYQGQPVALLADGADAAVVASWWNEPIGPWNFDLGFKDRKYNSGAAVYTDRAIYRPGQTVYFKGIARADDDGRYSLPGKPVTVSLADNNGQEVYSATLPLSSFGTFAAQYALPDYAPLGSYFLSCQCAPDGSSTGAGFAVQEYRKPEYIVGVSTDKTSYVNGETINTTATAGYFFGGPVAGAKVTTHVLAEDYYFTWSDPAGGGYYDFQDPDIAQNRQNSYYGEKRSDDVDTTDAAGQVKLALPATLGTAPLSQLLTIESSVQDSSNQAVSGNTQVIIHQGQFYIGLRPASYLDTVGQVLAVDVQTVADNGDRYPNAAVNVKFYQRVWEQTTEKDENGLDRPTWKPRDTPAGSGTVTTDANGHAQVTFTPSEAGEYRIVAESRDPAGNPIHSATSVYASDSAPDAAAVPWRQKNDSVVTLVADKAGYLPGDTAHILVTSPFSQATGLLTVERGHILSHRLVDLRGPAPVIDVPIDDSYLPNVYLGLSIVAPAGAGAMPGFRQGYVALPVSPAGKQLTVKITPSSTDLHPRDTVTYTIAVQDAAGHPAAAELSLALVDKAIFSLAGDTTPALIDSFYGVRPLDFTTASSLLVLVDQMSSAPAAGGKGGGGGGGPGSFVRSQFSDTAFWRAQVTTDAAGQAVVAVRLPDNLTTWRLTALAVTTDTRVGQATNEVVASKPLLVRPRTPRFLISGDRFEPAAILENYAGCTPDVDVSLVLAGATFVNGGPPAVQHLRLDGEKVASWAVSAGQGPTATLTFVLNSTTCNGASVAGDSVQVELPVKAPLTTETVATSGEVDKNGKATEHVFLPHGVDPAQGELTLNVAPSLAAGAAEGLNYIQDDQYDNTEETISRFLPLLQLSKAYASAGLTTTYSADVPGIVNRAIVRLYRDQHYDGGWGWFATSDSDPYLTAYALEGLTAARSAGYDVSQAVLDNAVQYLQNWLTAGPQDVRSGAPRLDTRAYVLFVLAQQGQNDLALARALAVRSNSLALYGRAYLALAFQRLGARDDANRLLINLEAAAKQTSTTAHWEEKSPRTAEAYLDMDTDARTTALILQALLARDKTDALIPRGVRWLMDNRRTGHWLSTQETATVLGTLASYMTASGELSGSGAWTATLNGVPWGTGGATGKATPATTTELRRSIADLLINQDNTITLERPGADGRLYYSMNLSYSRNGAAATARSEGLSVVREYVQPDGAGGTPGTAAGAPLKTAAAGDLVEIRLTVIAPTDAYYLVLDDPLPAGLEAVNGTLQTTGLTARLDLHPAGGDTGGKGGGQAATAVFFDNVEMRDDRTVLYATYLPAGVYEYRYLARATTPGSYTVLPAAAHLTYLPDVWGRTDSNGFTVTSGK